MNTTRMIFLIPFCIASQQILAQSTSALNLQLPAPNTTNQTTEAPAPQPAITTANVAANTPNLSPPYDTTYGDRRDAAENGCSDETYGRPQVHGSVGMGVAASNHASANYQTTELNVNKPLGSCDEPKGDVNASIRITRSNVNFGRRNGP